MQLKILQDNLLKLQNQRQGHHSSQDADKMNLEENHTQVSGDKTFHTEKNDVKQTEK